MTPFNQGRYWYGTLGLPNGVAAEIVQHRDGSLGVKFMWTNTQQAAELGFRADAFGSGLREGVKAVRSKGEQEPDPPLVGQGETER